MEINEKVAYLKGLMEGMDLDTTKKEGKLYAAILDILEEIAFELEENQDQVDEVMDGLDAVSDDLEDVEDVLFDEDEEEDEAEDDYYEDDLDDDEDCYATTCPTCEEEIFFDESILEDGEIICPNCGEKLEFDLSSIEEEECEGDCDCDKE